MTQKMGWWRNMSHYYHFHTLGVVLCCDVRLRWSHSDLDVSAPLLDYRNVLPPMPVQTPVALPSGRCHVTYMPQ